MLKLLLCTSRIHRASILFQELTHFLPGAQFLISSAFFLYFLIKDRKHLLIICKLPLTLTSACTLWAAAAHGHTNVSGSIEN